VDAQPMAEHWQQIYTARRADALSWFQESPDRSLELLLTPPLQHDAAILDVGGGASRLVDALLARGYTDVTVLDLASAALEQSAKRLGAHADRVHWITADITQWKPERRYEAWHDRAVFHFLTSAEQRAAYRAVLEAALAPDGVAVVATFALDGPERCSGLPVVRYSPESLAAELGPAFILTDACGEDHTTPAGSTQRFQWSRFQRR
jgi:SAM-dependent methyltransferase